MRTEIEELEFSKEIQEVSFYCFFILGFLHILSGLLLSNGLLLKTSWLLNRLLDVPFLMSVLIYLYAHIKVHSLQNKTYSHSQDLALQAAFLLIGLAFFIADIIFSNHLSV